MSRRTTTKGAASVAAREAHRAAFDLFNKVETARHQLAGTMGAMNALLEHGEVDEAVAQTMERHMLRDLAELDAAIDCVRDGILGPLHAAAFPEAVKPSTGGGQ